MINIFGGNTGTTYEQLQRQRKVADALKAQSLGRTPRNVGEGLTAIGNALAARAIDKRNDKRADELKSQYGELWGGITGALTGGAMGGGASYAHTTPEPDLASKMGYNLGTDEPMPRETTPAPKMPAGMTGDPMTDAAMASGAGGLDMGRDDMTQYQDAIAGIESNGSGGYQAVGPTHPKLGRALGKYQIMEANLPQWSREALGREVSPEEFMQSERIQDAIFNNKFGGYVDQYGPEGAAQAWFAGPGGVGKMGRKDSLGTSVADYTQKFSAGMTGQQGGQAGGVRTAQAGGGIDPSIMQLAQLLSAPDEFMPPGQKAVVQAILQQKLAGADPMQQLDLEYKEAQLDAIRNPVSKPTGTMQEYQTAQSQGFNGTFLDYQTALKEAGRSQNNINVKTGDETGRYIYGTKAGLPNGWRLDTQTGEASVTPNGPADVEQQNVETKAGVAQANKERSGGVVTADVGRALGIIEKSPGWTTGLGASLSQFPGTQARSLAGLLQTIKANVGFDRLQQMRDASVTGGALGAINKTEMDLLQSVLGNLEQSLDAEDLARNLKRVNDIYLEIIHGKGASAPGATTSPDYSNMQMQDLTANPPTTEEEAAAWNKRFDALQGGQ